MLLAFTKNQYIYIYISIEDQKTRQNNKGRDKC